MDARKNQATPINPQIFKVGQNSIKKQITKSSEHKPEDTSGKAKTDLLYRSIFKSKVPEERTKNLASKTIINDEKLEINNEKSLTIPNESSFRDEKLDNKIKKNILDFSKTSTGSKKTYTSKDSNNQNANTKFPEKIENILMFSDSFARYPLNFDKKNTLAGKTTPNKRSNVEEEKKGHFQPFAAKNYQGVSSSISTVKTLIKSIEKRKEGDQQNQNINKGVIIEKDIMKNSNNFNNTNEQFSNKSKNNETEQVLKKNNSNPPKMNMNLGSDAKKKNEASKKNSEDLGVQKKDKDYGNFHEKPILTNSETFENIKGKKLEYYLKNGIFEPLIIENSESGHLFEILEKVNFNYFVCESIREQRDEVKLFLTASNHYKTSKKILLLSACRKN